MKKILFLAMLIIGGWAGFSYFSAAWTREQFAQEVDSLLTSARGLSEKSLEDLILNKADQFNILLTPEDIEIDIRASDRDTTTSRLVEPKGFTAETRVLILHIRYGQPLFGKPRFYALDRERFFTAGIRPSSSPSPEQHGLPAE